jgi:anti-sigma factor RsiW
MQRDHDERRRDAQTELDEALSALHDAELSEEQAAALRARVDAEPALARRLDRFDAVDRRLRAHAAPEVSGDLFARLQRRIEKDRSGSHGSARLRTPARRLLGARLGLAGGLAAAAALTLYLALGSGPGNDPAREAMPGLVKSAIAPEGSPPSSAETVVAEREAVARPLLPEAVASAPGIAALRVPALDAEWAAASDEEVAIAMQYQVLADLELIRDLEILELLAALEEVGSRG